MSARTGLAAEVPTLEPCLEMTLVPGLADTFKASTCVWQEDGEDGMVWGNPQVSERCSKDVNGKSLDDGTWYLITPAPTVREMLAWLDNDNKPPSDTTSLWVKFIAGSVKLYDPDVLARACIEAAQAINLPKEQP